MSFCVGAVPTTAACESQAEYTTVLIVEYYLPDVCGQRPTSMRHDLLRFSGQALDEMREDVREAA
jgi:hypothetical protein